MYYPQGSQVYYKFTQILNQIKFWPLKYFRSLGQIRHKHKQRQLIIQGKKKVEKEKITTIVCC